jgi:hypothetical protein
VIHGLPWHVLLIRTLGLLPTNQPGRVPNRRAPRRHIYQHHGSGSNLSPGTNFHVTKNGGPCSNQHAIPNLGVPVTHRLPGPAQGDVVEDGDVVADDGRLTDDDAGGVVEEDSLPDDGGGVDVNGEDVGDAGLEREREGPSLLRPEHVRDAVGLDGEEALVVEEAVGEADAGGVAGVGREEVGDDGGAERGVRGERGEEEVVEERGEERGGAELVGEVEGEGAGQGRVGQHGGVEEGGERRLRVRVAAGLRLDLRPHPGLVVLRLRGRVRRHHLRGERRWRVRRHSVVGVVRAAADAGGGSGFVRVRLAGRHRWARGGIGLRRAPGRVGGAWKRNAGHLRAAAGAQWFVLRCRLRRRTGAGYICRARDRWAGAMM